MNRLKSILPHGLLVLFSLYILLPPLWVLRTSFVPSRCPTKSPSCRTRPWTTT